MTDFYGVKLQRDKTSWHRWRGHSKDMRKGLVHVLSNFPGNLCDKLTTYCM